MTALAINSKTSLCHLFVSAIPLVERTAFVIPAGGVLTIISLVDGPTVDTTFVDAGGFDELFPQPATVNMAVPNVIATR